MPKSNDLIESLKEKVCSFEIELSSSLSVLNIMEVELNKLCSMRNDWINQVSGVDEIEVITYKNRIESLRKKSEIALIELSIDVMRLNMIYEDQQLRQLIVATRPREIGETNKDREKEVQNLIKSGMEEIAKFVRQSIRLRTDLLTQCEDMNRQMLSLKNEFIEGHKLRLTIGIRRVQTYMDHLNDLQIASDNKYKKVTNDYLILRHNARVAKEILVKSQNEAHKVRRILQDNIDKLQAESIFQRERLEKNSADELKALTNEIRQTVISKEREYEDIILRVRKKKINAKITLKEHKKLVEDYDQKYEELLEKRNSDIKIISKELKKLKELIFALETNLSEKNDSEDLKNKISFLLNSL